MSAKSLKHHTEIFVKAIPVEQCLPGQVILSIGGKEFILKDMMPAVGGFFMDFENSHPCRIQAGALMVIKGQIVL